MKILITGFSGFVARHFLEYMKKENIEADVLGIDIQKPRYNFSDTARVHIDFKNVNLLEYNKLCEVCKNFLPDYVLHLAAFSSVAYSWNYPQESFLNNTNIFLNLVEAIRDCNPKCRILSVGSSEEYGDMNEQNIPFSENHILNPVSPYAVARVSQEMLSKVYVDGYGMDIVLTRSFNHIGPWQEEKFVVAGFAKKIYSIYKTGKAGGCIETGDISIVRDFLDVRDVVRAYYILLTKGKKGEIYNVCSGKGIPLSNIICLIAGYYDLEITTKINADYIRPNDNKVIVGNNEKIYHELGWQPTIPLSQTINDICQLN